jgi:hypothetical protein
MFLEKHSQKEMQYLQNRRSRVVHRSTSGSQFSQLIVSLYSLKIDSLTFYERHSLNAASRFEKRHETRAKRRVLKKWLFSRSHREVNRLRSQI